MLVCGYPTHVYNRFIFSAGHGGRISGRTIPRRRPRTPGWPSPRLPIPTSAHVACEFLRVYFGATSAKKYKAVKSYFRISRRFFGKISEKSGSKCIQRIITSLRVCCLDAAAEDDVREPTRRRAAPFGGARLAASTESPARSLSYWHKPG